MLFLCDIFSPSDTKATKQIQINGSVGHHEKSFQYVTVVSMLMTFIRKLIFPIIVTLIMKTRANEYHAFCDPGLYTY